MFIDGAVLYPKVDVNEWCEKYEIEISESPCKSCGEFYPFTIPIAHKDWRGVTQESHECGKGFVQSILRPIGKNEKEWETILGFLSQQDKGGE